MTTQRRVTFDDALALLEPFDGSDTDIQCSQPVLLKRPRIAVHDDDPLPKKRRALEVAKVTTSYQADVEDSIDDDDESDVTVASVRADIELIRDSIQLEKARKEAFLKQLRKDEKLAKAAWKASKHTKQDGPVLIPVAPVTKKDEVLSRSIFLLTLTDNTTIIPADEDNWYALNASKYHDAIIERLTRWAASGFTGIIRPGGGVKDSDAGVRLVDANVFNAKMLYVRERSPEKGQAHIHGVLTVNYYKRDGFFPHIDFARVRAFMDGIGGEKNRIYFNASHVKSEEYDAYRYLLVPAGEKKDAKKPSYSGRKKSYSTTA